MEIRGGLQGTAVTVKRGEVGKEEEMGGPRERERERDSPDVHEKPVREACEYLANWSTRKESRTDRERFAKFFVQRTINA